MGDASATGVGDLTPTRDENLAVWAVCSAIDGALFGVFIGQIAFYLRHTYRGDRPFLKCVVLVVSVLNTLRLVLYIYTVWTRFVTSRTAQTDSTDSRPWSTLAQIFLNSVAVLVIQTFYAHRIWKIRRSIGAAAVLGVLIICSFVGGVTLATYTVLAMTAPKLYTNVIHIEKAINVMFAVTDIALTSLLLYVLIRSSANGPSPLVRRLAFYTLSTGVFTCLSALAGIVLIFLFPESIMSPMIWYLAASLYSTSLMASLNARENLRTRYNVNTKLNTSGTSTMPRFAPPCMYESQTSDFHSVSIIGRSVHPHAAETFPADDWEILAERRSTHSFTDEEKNAGAEKHELTESSVDSDTSVSVEAEDVVASFRY
ncbi:hypothetical protein C8T65DRAFT_829257 [Cerioporus squamosus]|nr:hypothetical protein C8T65DRAFT_829257 [Cerioporus squamosus]